MVDPGALGWKDSGSHALTPHSQKDKRFSVVARMFTAVHSAAMKIMIDKYRQLPLDLTEKAVCNMQVCRYK